MLYTLQSYKYNLIYYKCFRKLNVGMHEQRVLNKKKADQRKAEEKRKIRVERKLLNPELCISRQGSVLQPSNAGSVTSGLNSRR